MLRSETFQSSVETVQVFHVAVEAATSKSVEPHIHLTRIVGGLSGSGTTTRYWDCCKPACASSFYINPPVASCAADGTTRITTDDQSGCAGGDAYMCNNQEPFAVNGSLAYGFVAASFVGGADTSMCCSCLRLTFTNTAIASKQMVVQITNTGSDLGANHFDIALPGGGNGIFGEGCKNQWGAQSFDSINSEADCYNLPGPLQGGCTFRFGWMQGASNPSVNFEQVECPGQLTSLTGCSGH